MSILYVNSITGNDSNNGSSWALAKKTLAATQTAASAGDTVYAHGIFQEAVAFNKSLSWIGQGLFAMDGNGGVLAGCTITSSVLFVGVIVQNYGTYGFQCSGSSCVLSLLNSIIQNCASGLTTTSANSVTAVTQNCVFLNNNTAAISTAFTSGSPAMTLLLTNCAFSGNGTSLLRTAVNGGFVATARSCAFRDPVFWNIDSNARIGSSTNNNAYDFSVGKCTIGGVDKTSLAAWQSAAGSPIDVNSIDRVWSGDVGDYANGVLRSNPAGYLLTAAPGGTPIGLQLPGVTISHNQNETLWNSGAVFSNTQLDGSNYLVLSGGAGSSGYWRSGVIDFGAAINAKSVEITLAGESPALPYVDYDTGDSPGYYNVRVRGSNSAFLAGDALPSWVIVPRRANIGDYMSNALRYWQIELELRS